MLQRQSIQYDINQKIYAFYIHRYMYTCPYILYIMGTCVCIIYTYCKINVLTIAANKYRFRGAT